ncbi:AAA family ATPase, partial [Streptococcus pneumoniae]|uniref:nucleotide-binding protein n=1 Tax=Streptococcus pneumoniae TaxID=1313 RepID=UPI00139E2898
MYNETKEYFNALQTNIQLSGDGLKVISVTSTVKNEGKSTISVGLSMSLALSGYKVLLLDVDLRNSVMSGMFHSRERIT